MKSERVVRDELPVVKSEPAETHDTDAATDSHHCDVSTGAAAAAELTVNDDNKFEFLDSVAVFHATNVRKSQQRQRLVTNIGPHRRALCARRDLDVRRALCKVDKVPASLV